MNPIKSLINVILLMSVSLLLSCVAGSKKEEVSGSPEIVNRLIANNITPANFPAKTQSIMTLSYTSIDKDLASSCSISSLNHVTVTQACSCDGAGECTVGVTSVGAYSGAASFSFNLVAGGKTSTTGKANFTISSALPGTNVPPTISSITGKTVSEGVSTGAIPFTIGDSDSVVTCGNVTAASSNTTIVPLSGIVISGTAPSCFVTVNPAANQIGLSNITLTLTDNGSPLPALTATTTFSVTTTAFNSPPTISSIAAQGTNEDTQTSAISFTIGDTDSVVTCANVTATSSNTALVSNVNLTVAGTAPNCTVRANPNLNQSGTTTITLTLTDNGNPLPAKTATTSFTLGVLAVNDNPTLSVIAPQSTNANVAKSVAFTIADVDSTLTCSGSVVVTSSNTTLVPNTNVVVSGTAPNCTAVITPVNNLYGTTTMTVKVTDNGTPMPAKTTTGTFVLTVNQVNIPPTISTITAKVTNEDTPLNLISFTIGDTDSTVYCSNVVGTSTNNSLIDGTGIVITGTAPNCKVTLNPKLNQFGSASITLTLSDNGTPMPAETATTTFILTVNAVNDAPTISTISSVSTDEDTPSAGIPFTITDVDSTLVCNGGVVGVSSDTALIPNSNIVISGTAPNCIATITPASNKNGSATITLTVTDNGTPTPAKTASTTFNINVAAVLDLSGTLSIANNLSGVASGYASNSYARKLSFAGLVVDESITSLEVCLGTASGSCDVSSWVAASYTTGGSAPSISLNGSYRMVSDIGGAQHFVLSPSCSGTNNYYYSIRATNSGTRLSNVLSTPAWSFWEPSCLGMVTQWLDASEASTIITATGVSSWADKTGNGNTMSQGSGPKQPTYSATGLGSLPGVTFNGSTHTLAGSSIAYAQAATSILAVAKTSVGNKFLYSEGRNVAATNASYSPFMNSSTNNITGQIVNNSNGTDLNLPATGAVFGDNTVRLGLIEDSGSTFFSYTNGQAQTQPIINYTRGATTVTNSRLGSRFRNNTESSFFNGTVAEFIIINGIMNSSQRQKLEGYEAHKWGANGNLQVSHPYSITPP